ncbi:hypothetical protein JL720_13179 [Aureococcus anophagefferens]|nr:hypothetical protein JL720_13179 [Aureococcus anophagefferens]
MGAAATTAKQPLAEVDIKNEIGVLYGEEAQQAFAAAKKGDVVAWPKAQAYAEAHGLLDPKAVLFKNLRQFKIAREQIEAIYDEHFSGAVRDIPWRGEDLGDDWRQCALHGAPAETLDELYAVAEKALLKYGEVMTAACPSGAVLKLAPLKGLARARRGQGAERNRFNPPCFNGYRDILMNVAVRVEGDAGEIVHLCELQIHHAPIKESEPMHKSHVTYEFFREFFLGNADAVEQTLNMLCALPVADAEDVEDLVDRVLGSDRASDTKLLGELAALLESIAEHSSAVRVREKVLEIKEREFGRDHAQRELLERALAIEEREYGGDHVEVASTLKSRERVRRTRSGARATSTAATRRWLTLANLGNAHGSLGDNAKARELLERALAIKEREYGRDHAEVAVTLANLGNAYNRLGDYAKACELYERALAIFEREYGRDHVQVASTLVNLGNAYGDLGDDAKKRDLLERALAIFEREFGRDHPHAALCRRLLGG